MKDMDREYVEANNVIERYLLGKLDEKERDAFEALFIGDPDLISEIESAEAMLHGFKHLEEADEAVSNPTMSRNRMWQWVAAVLLVMIPTSYFLGKNSMQTTSQAGVPVIALGAVRGEDEDGATVIETRENQTAVVLMLDLGFGTTGTFDLVLRNEAGEELQRHHQIEVGEEGLLNVIIAGEKIRLPGRYTIQAKPIGGGETIHFQIVSVRK